MRSLQICLLVATVLPGPCGHVDAWIKEFFEMPRAARMERFHDYTLEQQLKLHLVATCVRRPGDDSFEASVSSHGRLLDDALAIELDNALSECEVIALLKVAERSQAASDGCVSVTVKAAASPRVEALRIEDRAAEGREILQRLRRCGRDIDSPSAEESRPAEQLSSPFEAAVEAISAELRDASFFSTSCSDDDDLIALIVFLDDARGLLLEQAGLFVVNISSFDFLEGPGYELETGGGVASRLRVLRLIERLADRPFVFDRGVNSIEEVFSRESAPCGLGEHPQGVSLSTSKRTSRALS